MQRYQHTQTGSVMIISLTAGMLVLAYYLNQEGQQWVSGLILAILATCLVLFSTLTVEIDEEAIEVWFGTGLIRKRIPLKEITSCRVVRHPWYYGWGIRLTPHGWLYRVSGLDAVELHLENGKKLHVGTDEPEELWQALEMALGFEEKS